MGAPPAPLEQAEASREGDDQLERLERELTKEVPALLDAMNRASDEVNLFEQRAGEAQRRHKALLEQWSRCYEDLRAQHGVAIDRVKPYIDAAQVLNVASRRVQDVVREFSAASSLHLRAKEELRQVETCLEFGAHHVQLEPEQQDGLSRATVRVVKCQQDCASREQEYARALREYQEAQAIHDSWRAQIGDTVIKRTLPCFKQLQQHQLTLASEQNRINSLTERAKQAKLQYGNVLRELDRINVAVHAARKGSSAPKVTEAAAPPEAVTAKAAEVAEPAELVSVQEPAPEEVPERVPEAADARQKRSPRPALEAEVATPA